MANPNVSIAIDTGGRAAEFNTLSGQERIKEWNEEQEKEKEKLARRLVKQGIVSQEIMDQAYDSLTLVDLEEIRADHRRAVSKDTKGLGEMSYDAHKEGRQAQFDVLRGDFQLAKVTKATSTLTTDLSPLGMVYGGIQLFEQYSAYKQLTQAEEKPSTPTPPQKWSPIRSPYDVGPSEPFQSKEHARNANKLMSAINPHSPTQFEYAAAYSGQIKNPDDFRNLAPGAEYFKIAGDIKDRLSAKWGGKTRNATQKLALNVTGNPHVAVTAGFGGALALELVADPLNAAGGAGKVAQAGKAVIKGASGARAISRAAQGSAGFADAVAAAKQGASLSARTAANVTAGKAVTQTVAHQAEQAAVHQAEKSVARDIDLRVKPEIKRGKDGKVKGVEKTQVHHIIPQALGDDKFLKKIGYDIHQRANKMILPTVEGGPLFTAKRSIHQGPHLKEVIKMIDESIRKVEYESMLHGWSHQRSIEEVNKALAPHRALLKSGDIPLNKNFQPQAEGLHNEWMMKRLNPEW
ncbi:MAG: AHH domain-containing protein [Alphaproteobacteria bacterium]|nr:AHH domain-containing protein [Alphaproteobacteria bacterium]